MKPRLGFTVAILIGIVCVTSSCGVFSDPPLRGLFISYTDRPDNDLNFAWHVVTGDTVPLVATECAYEAVNQFLRDQRRFDCRPVAASFQLGVGLEPLGETSGVERVRVVMRDTIASGQPESWAELLVGADRDGVQTQARLFVFPLRRLFVEEDSLLLQVGDTLPVPLAGERFDSVIERRMDQLPETFIAMAGGDSSSAEVLRSGFLWPVSTGSASLLLANEEMPFVQTSSILLVGRAAGRDTLVVRTRFRVVRTPVVVRP